MKLAIFAALCFVAACSGEREVLPPVSAAAPPAEAREEVEACLSLVESRDFEQALPVCREARRLAPRDEQVRAAMQVAQAHRSVEP